MTVDSIPLTLQLARTNARFRQLGTTHLTDVSKICDKSFFLYSYAYSYDDAVDDDYLQRTC